MIGIVDYHLNNLRSVQKALAKAGADAFISDDPERLASAEKLVLPGVGAYGAAMENLRSLKLLPVITSHVAAGRPLLGICLGMQLLFAKSFEQGEHTGLGIIPGVVQRFPPTVKVPHMGWNQITPVRTSPLLTDVQPESFVYFVHSYYVVPEGEVTLAVTDYGVRFTSIVQRDTVFGIQFHPEKSQRTGIQLLKNFAGI